MLRFNKNGAFYVGHPHHFGDAPHVYLPGDLFEFLRLMGNGCNGSAGVAHQRFDTNGKSR